MNYIMIREKIFKIFSLLLITAVVLNFLALKLYLYWTVHYFDSFVHFLAGTSVGLAGLWLMLGSESVLKSVPTKKQIFTFSLLSALSIGLLWEIYELTFGVTRISDGIHYITDTGSDIFMDVMGGLCAGFYTKFLFSKTTNG